MLFLHVWMLSILLRFLSVKQIYREAFLFFLLVQVFTSIFALNGHIRVHGGR